MKLRLDSLAILGMLDETDGSGSTSNSNFNEYVFFAGGRPFRIFLLTIVHAWIIPLQYVTAGLWFCTSGWPTLSGVWKGSGFKFGAAQKSRAKSKPAFQKEVDSKPGPLKTKGSTTRKFKFKGSATRPVAILVRETDAVYDLPKRTVLGGSICRNGLWAL